MLSGPSPACHRFSKAGLAVWRVWSSSSSCKNGYQTRVACDIASLSQVSGHGNGSGWLPGFPCVASASDVRVTRTGDAASAEAPVGFACSAIENAFSCHGGDRNRLRDAAPPVSARFPARARTSNRRVASTAPVAPIGWPVRHKHRHLLAGPLGRTGDQDRLTLHVHF